jgi:hypothetical protein
MSIMQILHSNTVADTRGFFFRNLSRVESKDCREKKQLPVRDISTATKLQGLSELSNWPNVFSILLWPRETGL